VWTQIDALYNTAATPGALPAEIETAAMTRLRNEAHARMLGNGLCTRPVELECRMESACETCAYFETGPEIVPVLLRQRDHARPQPTRPRRALRHPHRTSRKTPLTPITRITPGGLRERARASPCELVAAVAVATNHGDDRYRLYLQTLRHAGAGGLSRAALIVGAGWFVLRRGLESSTCPTAEMVALVTCPRCP
jgi:hypothetical protein